MTQHQQDTDTNRARRCSVRLGCIAIYSALLLALNTFVQPTSDGTETHGGPRGTTAPLLTAN
jgi:hypothetical protein